MRSAGNVGRQLLPVVRAALRWHAARCCCCHPQPAAPAAVPHPTVGRAARARAAVRVAHPTLTAVLSTRPPQRTSSCMAFSPRIVTVHEIFSLRRMLNVRTV
jgi:hypothetical protein